MNLSNIFLKKGFLLQPDLINFITQEETELIIEILQAINAPKIISLKFFYDNKTKIVSMLNSFLELKKFDPSIILNLKKKLEEEKEKKELINEVESEINKSEEEKRIEEKKFYYNGNLFKPKKIEVKDFLSFFKSRYEWFKDFLKDRKELVNLTSIDKLPTNNQNVSIIGMVMEKRETKNKNVILELEDGKGIVKVLINKNRTVYEKTHSIVEDEVIGIKGFGNKEIIFASEIVFPEIVNLNNKKCFLDKNALFLADIHIGSDKFLESNFKKAIKWINGEDGNERQRDKAKKISHIFFVGDIVDGVGIYPGQENELLIKDIIEQYKYAYELFDEIRKDIKLVFIPGNHDAARITEPQVFNMFSKPLQKLENAEFLPNPTFYNLYGYNVLLYHGASFDYYANKVYSLKAAKAYENPEELLKFFLQKRHLAPTHGSTVYSPTDEDFFIIKKVPDVFVTAHIHKTGATHYKNIILISTSCWQSRTPYQEKFGHIPDPCKIPLFNTKTKGVHILDFN
ncbi:MAG: metallophosphoesterase [Candidatus Pacearchaeota archaeon]